MHPDEARTRSRLPTVLLGVFALWWLVLAIKPLYRQDWLLENLLVFAAVPLLIATHRRLRFSDFTYCCLFAFFVLHEVGAHYTYSLVPYDSWVSAWTGVSPDAALGFERNQFDRLMHFLYGLLITPAAIELFAYYGRYPRSWAFLFPGLFMLSHSALYELIEWGAALAFGGDLGQAYLGTQGDVWDAQKDMALGGLGTLVTLTAYGLTGWLPVRTDERWAGMGDCGSSQ